MAVDGDKSFTFNLFITAILTYRMLNFTVLLLLFNSLIIVIFWAKCHLIIIWFTRISLSALKVVAL